MRPVYYNEFDPYAAQWLRNLISAGHLPAGDVDERSIVDVAPDDLAGYAQCHFFAGIGGWALAARLAGWPDDRELWTGSAPCQPFSVAGQQRGTDDDRHLWPHLFRLARARRPAVLMGEQVAAAVGKDWLDGIAADLEGIGYACGAAVVPACAVDAPHRRDRLWFVAHAHGFGGQVDSDAGRCTHGSGAREVAGLGRAGDGALGNAERARLEGYGGHVHGTRGWTQPDRPAAATCRGSDVADTDVARASKERQQRSGQLGGASGDQGACVGDVADTHGRGRCARTDDQATGHREAATAESRRSAWDSASWLVGHDGKARRTPEPESGIRLLAYGVSGRVAVVRPGFKGDSENPEALHWYNRIGALRALGNAIVPAVAAEVIGAYMDCRP